MTDTEIHEIALSDHAPVALSVGAAPRVPDFHLWRFPSFLYNNDNFQRFLHSAWKDYEVTKAQHSSTPTLYWEASKAYLRGRIMSYVMAYKRNAHQAYAAQATQAKDSLAKAKQEFDMWDHRLSLLK